MSKFDVRKHRLVPKHELLSEKDANAVLKKFDTTKDQLPKILSRESLVKVLKAKPGQVIRVTRKSPTAGEAIAYRAVVGK